MSSKVYAPITTISEDERVAVTGPVESLIGPGGAVGGPGTIAAAPDSAVQSTVNVTGFGSNDIALLLNQVLADKSQSQEHLAGLAGSLATAASATTRSLTDIVGATKAPEYAQTQQLSPVFLLAGIAALLLVVTR